MIFRTAVLVAALSGGGFSQALLWEHFAPQPDSFYGQVLAPLKDVNFDGVDDIVVSSSGASNGSISLAGYVGVLSGATGNVVWEFFGTAPGMLAKFVALAGDMNGDGAGDLWASFNPGGGAPPALV